MLDKQGAQLLAVAILVLSRTWISDRIASLNGASLIVNITFSLCTVNLSRVLNIITLCISGTTVKYVLEQDKAAFIKLIGISVLQSAASSFVAPSLR